MGADQLIAVIMFSIVLGLYIDVDESNGRTCHILGMAQEINDFTMIVVDVIIRLTPIGLFGLLAPVVIKMDLGEAAANVGILVFSHALGQFVHMCFVYPLAYVIVLRSNPFPYLLNCVPAMITALGTSSSAATLPTTLKCAVKKNNIPEPIANFVLSMGATVNMGKWCMTCGNEKGMFEDGRLTVLFFFFSSGHHDNRRHLHRIQHLHCLARVQPRAYVVHPRIYCCHAREHVGVYGCQSNPQCRFHNVTWVGGGFRCACASGQHHVRTSSSSVSDIGSSRDMRQCDGRLHCGRYHCGAPRRRLGKEQLGYCGGKRGGSSESGGSEGKKWEYKFIKG